MNSPRFTRALAAALFSLGFSLASHAADSKPTPAPGSAPHSASSKSAKVDLNTADHATLETLPGVGPAVATSIIAARPFASVNELEKVSGIGPARMKQLKGLVTVSKSTAVAARSTSGTAPAQAHAGKKVDVNTADVKTLEELVGVGPQIAQAIVAARPFKSVDDLDRVPGIGTERLEQLRMQVTVSKPVATMSKPATTQNSRARTRNDERVAEPTGRSSRVSGRSDDSATASSHARLINLNTATRAELESLPEIGPVKAKAIMEARPFSSIDDVMRVKGIKEGTFEVIKDRITVR